MGQSRLMMRFNKPDKVLILQQLRQVQIQIKLPILLTTTNFPNGLMTAKPKITG
jgi:hypothetical protein